MSFSHRLSQQKAVPPVPPGPPVPCRGHYAQPMRPPKRVAFERSLSRSGLRLVENSSPSGDAQPMKKGYHLVMTNSLPWKDPAILKFGKPSIK